MMMARPRTAGVAARRKQRAMAAARARADSRQEAGRPQSARAGPDGRRQSASGRTEVPERHPGPSMVIPKLLMVLSMTCVAVGAITYALTSVESEQIKGGKLAGIIIIVIGLILMCAAILVCLIKRIKWGAEQEENGRQPEVSTRQKRYAANHIEDETSVPPTKAWNGSTAENGKPPPGLNTGDIEMTLTSARQRSMFSTGGTENGGFLPDNHHVTKGTPEIRVTCEAEDHGKGAAEEAYVADVHVTLDDDQSETRPPSIPPLDLSGVFPSPISPRKLMQKAADTSDEEAPPMDSAPLSAHSDTNHSPGGTMGNPPKDLYVDVNGLIINKQLTALTDEPDVIEMTIIKTGVKEQNGIIQHPETVFEHDVTSRQLTGSSEKIDGVSDNISPPDKAVIRDEFESGMSGSGGRGRVE